MNGAESMGTQNVSGVAAAGVAACLLLSGCAGGTVSTEVLRTSSLSISHESVVSPVNPIETYARLARGAKTCWLGPGKPLAAGHLFNADVPAGGKAAEISLHVRSTGQPSPRAQKAFVISIVAAGDGAAVTSENRRLDGPTAEAMKADIARWAKAESPSCSEAMDAKALATLPVPPLPVRKPVTVSAKSHRKAAVSDKRK